MTKKDFECQVHTWIMKKAKSRVYKGGSKRNGGDSLDSRIFNFFTLKSNILAQDQTSFFPALYKFIVWATWAWIRSRFGFKSNLVLTIGAVCGKLLDLIRKRFGFSAKNGRIRFASTNGRATSG